LGEVQRGLRYLTLSRATVFTHKKINQYHFNYSNYRMSWHIK